MVGYAYDYRIILKYVFVQNKDKKEERGDIEAENRDWACVSFQNCTYKIYKIYLY